jgi:hypothetical protein
LSTVFIPETHCLHGHCVDHSRFLKVFVTATTRRDTLTTTWEVCAGVIDLLQLTYAPDELEQDSQTTTPDGCMSGCSFLHVSVQSQHIPHLPCMISLHVHS